MKSFRLLHISLWLFLSILKISGQEFVFKHASTFTDARLTDFTNPYQTSVLSNNKVFLFNNLTVTVLDTLGQSKKFFLEKEIPAEILKQFDSRYKQSCLMNQSTLIIKNRNMLAILDYNGDSFTFKKSIRLSKAYQDNLMLAGDTLYIFGIYNFHEKALDQVMRAGYAKVNLKTGAESSHETPFENLVLTHFSPNKFMDFSGKSYAICDPLRYKIKIYNFRNQLQDSICAPDSVFSTSPKMREFQNKFDPNIVGPNPTSYFEEMYRYLNVMDRVWQISYLDTNVLFVRFTRNSLNAAGSDDQLFFDHIWIHTSMTWKLIKQVNHRQNMIETSEVNRFNVWPQFVVGSKVIIESNSLNYLFWGAGEPKFQVKPSEFYSPGLNSQPVLNILTFGIK